MNKKIIINSILVIGMTLSLAGCGKKETATTSTGAEEFSETPTATPTVDTSLVPDGTYFSEITGLPISTSIQNQRPIAVMVDCEEIAFPHYGVAEADVVYELMNNVMNGRVTRFMAVYKDYDNVAQIGNVRSTRTTNVWLAGEWNAILVHDGQASYASPYYSEGYASQHLSSGFTRVDNGKPSEFTEYVMPGEVVSRIQDAGFDHDYNEYKQDGDHFTFVKYNTELDTSSFDAAAAVQLPYPHNSTSLAYNVGTKSYDLSMYGTLHQDAEDNQVLTFTNVLLLDCDYTQYPEGGYIYYNIVDNSGSGYYLTNGKMEPITWKKAGENNITHYYDANGNDLEMNRGKTYITMVPSDVWGDVSIQ